MGRIILWVIDGFVEILVLVVGQLGKSLYSLFSLYRPRKISLQINTELMKLSFSLYNDVLVDTEELANQYMQI